MILDVPTSACVASVVMTLTSTVGYTESPFTLEGQSFKWPGRRFEMSFRMPPFVSRAIAADWIAFGAQLNGRYNLFLMGDPAAKTPRGVASGTPVVSGAGQTGNTLVTSGWTPNTTNIMMKNDYIQIGTGASTRLYMLVENANSDGSGNANLTIEPELRYSPANGETVIVNNPKGLFRLSSNNFSWRVSPGKVYSLSFEAQEAL